MVQAPRLSGALRAACGVTGEDDQSARIALLSHRQRANTTASLVDWGKFCDELHDSVRGAEAKRSFRELLRIAGEMAGGEVSSEEMRETAKVVFDVLSDAEATPATQR